MKAFVTGAMLALAAAITVMAAEQDKKSANYWLPRCKSYVNGNDRAITGDGHFCAGLIEGIGYLAASAKSLCIPDGATRGQTMLVVIAYIEARPKRMHELFWQLALEALHDAWPCKP